MPMEMLATPGFLVGLLFGIPAGMAFQHAKHLVRAYQNAKTALPAQKEVAASAEVRGAIWLVAVVAVGLLVAALLIRNG